MVDKTKLNVDFGYQRAVNTDKVRAIASAWSWPACGALSVADRDGELYVFEGSHRAHASLLRSDITTMPCLIYPFNSIPDEARAFLAANCNRKTMSVLDKFGAADKVNDPAFALVRKTCESLGRKIDTRGSNGGRILRSVGVAVRLAGKSPSMFAALFPLVDALSGDAPVTERILDGLFWIEGRMPEGQSLLSDRWRSRLVQIGGEVLDAGARRKAAVFAKGGAQPWGLGILDEVNKGLRNRLSLRVDADAESK